TCAAALQLDAARVRAAIAVGVERGHRAAENVAVERPDGDLAPGRSAAARVAGRLDLRGRTEIDIPRRGACAAGLDSDVSTLAARPARASIGLDGLAAGHDLACCGLDRNHTAPGVRRSVAIGVHCEARATGDGQVRAREQVDPRPIRTLNAVRID